MKQFTLNPTDFTRIMTAAKLVINTRGTMPMIHCKVNMSSDSLTATAIDSKGHRAHRITVPCTVIAGSDFSRPFLIPVVTTKPSAKLPFVSVDVGDDYVVYTMGAITTKLDVIEGAYPNIDKHLPTTEPVAAVCVSPVYMRDAFAAFADEESVTIELHEGRKPVIVRAKTGSFALVCTIRNENKGGEHSVD